MDVCLDKIKCTKFINIWTLPYKPPPMEGIIIHIEWKQRKAVTALGKVHGSEKKAVLFG